MEGTTKTYEDKHALGITFPTFCHPYVLFFGQIEIHSEQSSRTIGKVGLSWLGFWLGLGSIRGEAIVIYSRYSKHEGEAMRRGIRCLLRTWIMPCRVSKFKIVIVRIWRSGLRLRHRRGWCRVLGGRGAGNRFTGSSKSHTNGFRVGHCPTYRSGFPALCLMGLCEFHRTRVR
jgi:hypothetical protein